MEVSPTTSEGRRNLFKIFLDQKERSPPSISASSRPQTPQQIYKKREVQMLSLHLFIPHLRKNDWLCAVDLQDAYIHIPIVPRHRKFLIFRVGCLQDQYAVLPFCLKSAPQTFSKCMVVVAAQLRKQGIFV